MRRMLCKLCAPCVIALAMFCQTATAATVTFANGLSNAFVSNYSGTHDTLIINTVDWENVSVGGRNSLQIGTGYAGGARFRSAPPPCSPVALRDW